MKQKLKKQAGITLIVLVITIIVILILAGVAISTLMGENGLINRAVSAKEKTEDAEVQERIALAYQAASIDRYVGNSENVANSIEEELETTYGTGNVTVTPNSDGSYSIKITGKGIYEIDANGNVGKSVTKPEISYKITQTGGAAIEENTRYASVLVKITVTNIGQVNISEIKLYNSANEEIAATGEVDKEAGVATFEVNKNMTYTAKVTGTAEGKSTENKQGIKVSCVKLATLERYNKEGKIEIRWIDQKNNIIENPIAPDLRGNMKKLTFNSETNAFEETTSNDWYSYNSVTSVPNTTSYWANAKTTDGSMWVWIPRYAYKITYYDTDGTTPIGYSCARGIVTVDGDVVAENNEGIETVGDYIVHPAFTASAENGGGFGAISGFWFAKFETSGSLDTGNVFKSVAGAPSLTGKTIGEFYTYARQQLYGETGTTDSLDNCTSFGNSHMVKNSEWGAVAYLAQSSYGTNGAKVNPNSSNQTTGQSATDVYTNNVTQSTTHNPYGIYDMNGTSWEYVASYVNNSSSSTYMSNGGKMTETATVAQSTKYKTVYEYKGSQQLNYEASAKMKGDAVYETSNRYSSSTGSWYSASAGFPDSNPFFIRSGDFTSSYAGTFCFNISGGGGGSYGSCRLALVF